MALKIVSLILSQLANQIGEVKVEDYGGKPPGYPHGFQWGSAMEWETTSSILTTQPWACCL